MCIARSRYAYSEDAASKIGRAALLSLYYLCGGKTIRAGQFRSRQEAAARNGLIPHLMYYIHTHSGSTETDMNTDGSATGGAGGGSIGLGSSDTEMESLALRMFCALPYGGRAVRTSLWEARAHLFYIALLEHRSQLWRLQALEALALWLGDGNASHPKRTELERVVLLPKHVAKLVPLFKSTADENIGQILTPYVQLLSSSPSLARACSPIAPDVLLRLGRQDLEHSNQQASGGGGGGGGAAGVKVTIDLLKVLLLLLSGLRSPASFIEEHSLDFAMHDMYTRKRWGEKPIVGQVATQVLHAIERFR